MLSLNYQILFYFNNQHYLNHCILLLKIPYKLFLQPKRSIIIKNQIHNSSAFKSILQFN